MSLRVKSFTLTDGETVYRYDGYEMTDATAKRIRDLMDAWLNRRNND